MENSPVSLKALKYSIICAFAIATFVIIKPYLFSKTFITFCDIGQGDAIYIHQADGFDMLIDTGPNESVLECLGKVKVFTDKNIDIVFISHPHFDHYGGLAYIFSHYRIGTVYMSPLRTQSTTFNKLVHTIEKRSHLQMLTENTYLPVGKLGSMAILWPSQSYLKRNSYASSASSQDIRYSSLNPNDFSLVQLYRYNGATILLTGDISKGILLSILQQYKIRTVDILKIPHHGSDTGLSEEILDMLTPHNAVISVAKINRYKHPSPLIIDMLRSWAIPTFLTSESGSITFDYKNGEWVLRQSCFLFFNC